MDTKFLPILLTLAAASLPPLSAAAADEPRPIVHSGMCDASAAVAVGPTMFIVANDEDNVLRVYRRGEPGRPVAECDLTSFLRADPKRPECDIEGAAAVGDRVYWITSHGTNKDGKFRPSRHRLFATKVKPTADGAKITPLGKPYQGLVAALDRDTRTAPYELGRAAEKSPEAAGALNIEGLAATPEGALLIGFRNPLPDGKALIVPLENPHEVIEAREPRFGKPIQLSLGGLGIRSIEYFPPRKQYLIIAGPHGPELDFHLYQWAPSASGPQRVEGIDFRKLRPEALFAYPDDSTGIQVLSDDGTRDVDGTPCKKADPDKRSFRSLWIRH